MRIGFVGLLTLLLIAGKIFGFLAISWWMALLPVIIVVGISVVSVIIALIIALICVIKEKE